MLSGPISYYDTIYETYDKKPTLYVPKGSLNAYQSAKYWLQSFEKIVEE